MDPKYRYLLGEGVHPPLEKVDAFLGPKMGIFMPRGPIELPAGTHIHSSFEFSIPISLSPQLVLEGNRVILEKSKIYPFNSEQIHGTPGEMSSASFIALQVDNGFLEETASQVYGQSHVCFRNLNSSVHPQLHRLIQSFIDECSEQQEGYQFMIQALSVQMVVTLLRTLGSNMPAMDPERSYTDHQGVSKILEFYDENYGSAFTLEDITKLVNYSPYHFIKIFKRHTGKTPNEYLMDLRIEKARLLLRDSRRTMTEIAHTCGFKHSSYFSKTFRDRVGVSPLKYRKEATTS